MSTTEHLNGLGIEPRAAASHIESRPRIRTRLRWRMDRVRGLIIAVVLVGMWAGVVALAIAVTS